MAKKPRSPWVGEFRDANGVSTENHIQMTDRLVKAGRQGIHNKPGPPKPKKGSK